MINTNPSNCGNAGFVQKFIGTAFEHVKRVSEELDAVLFIVENMEHILAIEEFKADIVKVGQSITDVNKVADNLDSINHMLSELEIIKKVADNTDVIVQVGKNIEDLTKVSKYLTELKSISDNLDSLVAVGSNIESVKVVSELDEEIQILVENLKTLETINNSIDLLTAIVNSLQTLEKVASNLDLINVVIGNLDLLNFIKGVLETYNMVVCTTSIEDMQSLSQYTKYVRLYNLSTLKFEDYIYFDNDFSGDIVTSTGSWKLTYTSDPINKVEFQNYNSVTSNAVYVYLNEFKNTFSAKLGITSTDNVAGSTISVTNTNTHANSVSIGNNSSTSKDKQVSVGSSTIKRVISNIADGTEDSDAASIKQLKDTETRVTNKIPTLEKIGEFGLLVADNNLADIPDKKSARDNIGAISLADVPKVDLSTTLMKANNLSDLPNKTTALTNLGAASKVHTHAISDITNLQTQLNAKLEITKNLSDILDKNKARDNLGVTTELTKKLDAIKNLSDLTDKAVAQDNLQVFRYMKHLSGANINNLSTLNDIGVYYQESSTTANIENGYPEQSAGTLVITPASATSVIQEYTTYIGVRKYVRLVTSTTVNEWQQMVNLNQANFFETYQRFRGSAINLLQIHHGEDEESSKAISFWKNNSTKFSILVDYPYDDKTQARARLSHAGANKAMYFEHDGRITIAGSEIATQNVTNIFLRTQEVNLDGLALKLKAKTLAEAIYISFFDTNDRNLGYIGRGGKDDSLTWANVVTGKNVTMYADGTLKNTGNLILDSANFNTYAAAKAHNHKWSEITDVPSASVTGKGIVQLNSTINSTSEVLAATPKAVKTAYDKANEALTLASGKAPTVHTHAWGDITGVPVASTTVSGITSLNNTVTSTSTTVAGTANSVKVAYDKGVEALTKANSVDTNVNTTNTNVTTLTTRVTTAESKIAALQAIPNGLPFYEQGKEPTTNQGDIYINGIGVCTWTTVAPAGYMKKYFDSNKNYTSSTTVTFSKYIRRFLVTCVGGGGGGSNATISNPSLIGRGGNGGVACKELIVDTSKPLTITVGVGGTGSKAYDAIGKANLGSAGSISSFGSYLSTSGGKGGEVKANAVSEPKSFLLNSSSVDNIFSTYGMGGNAAKDRAYNGNNGYDGVVTIEY